MVFFFQHFYDVRVFGYPLPFPDARIHRIHPRVDKDNGIFVTQYEKSLITMIKRVIYRSMQRTEVAVFYHCHHHAEHRNGHSTYHRIVAAKDSYAF